MRRIAACLIFLVHVFQLCRSQQTIAYNVPDPDCTGAFSLCTDPDKERLGRQAVKAIHEQMDDDKDGMIEMSESSEFIREELQSNADAVRHRHFQSDDIQITFNDLWTQWQSSPVYNWTVDDVVKWLTEYAHLPMYVENFRRNQIDGRMIPRLAANERHYLSSVMQIRDLRHKRRLIIKATDVVLFGPPPSTHNFVKDGILISALIISIGACVYAFVRHRKTQESMKVMMKELEMLQRAEGDLASVTGKIQAMENELKDKAKVERGLLNSWFVEVQQTKDEADNYRKRRGSAVDPEKQLRLALQEIDKLRFALKKAEEHAQHQSYEAPEELIELLKRTYSLEEIAFENIRRSAENAMITAKEQMNKISKMQKGFLGAVRIAHTGCMENISELIHEAKERLAEVQHEYVERERRWSRIAALLDREDIISNTSPTTPGSTHSGGSGNASLAVNGGTAFRMRDSNLRPKLVPPETTGLVNTSTDASVMSRSISNLASRGVPSSASFTGHLTSQDSVSLPDSNTDYTNSPSSILKRRTVTSNLLSTNRSSTERLNTPSIPYSRSINGLYDLSNTSTGIFDPAEIPSLAKHAGPVFDLISDFGNDSNDFNMDEQDRKSNITESLSDDQQSISSNRSRTQVLSTKLLKPFQNLRVRKKSSS